VRARMREHRHCYGALGRASLARRRAVSMTGRSALIGRGLPGRPAWNGWCGRSGSDASCRNSLRARAGA